MLVKIPNVIEFIDNLLRKVILYGTLGLMGYVLYYHLNQYLITKNTVVLTDYFSNNDYGMFVWRRYRDSLLGLLMLDVLLASIVSVFLMVKGNYARVVKIGLTWWSLALFLIFSYALTELISKFFVWFIT